MTMTDERVTASDLAERARTAWQDATAKPTAVELGRQFGRSERWGRDRIKEARTSAGSTAIADRQDWSAAAEPAAEPALVAEPVAEPAAEVAADPVAGRVVDRGGDVDQVDEVGTWLTRVTWWLSVLAVAVVGGVALVMSYEHMRLLAEESGETWRAWLLPISVDGLMIAASSVILARQRQGLAAGWLPWLSLATGVAVSIAANVAQAGSELPADAGPGLLLQARLVAAWPPIAALAGVEMLMRQVRTLRAADGRQSGREQ